MKTAVITGGSSGIGLACAELFKEKGYKTYSISRNGESKDGIIQKNGDVTDEKRIEAIISEIYSETGSIDVLVCCAGYGISGTIEYTVLEKAKSQMDVNFFGTFICDKAVIKYMRKNESGTIINISSMAAPLPIPFQAFYSASKSAIDSMTMALANELRPFNIKVSAIRPGDIKTEFTARREKNNEGERYYGSTIKNSVEAMEKDEQNGMPPKKIAKAVYKTAQKLSPPPLSTVGFKYKFFTVFSKLLPERIINEILGLLYAKGS